MDTKECTTGIIINDRDTCKEACKELGFSIEEEEDVRGGSPCLKTQARVCRQDGSNRKEASLICKVSGWYRLFIVKYNLTCN